MSTSSASSPSITTTTAKTFDKFGVFTVNLPKVFGQFHIFGMFTKDHLADLSGLLGLVIDNLLMVFCWQTL